MRFGPEGARGRGRRAGGAGIERARGRAGGDRAPVRDRSSLFARASERPSRGGRGGGRTRRRAICRGRGCPRAHLRVQLSERVIQHVRRGPSRPRAARLPSRSTPARDATTKDRRASPDGRIDDAHSRAPRRSRPPLPSRPRSRFARRACSPLVRPSTPRASPLDACSSASAPSAVARANDGRVA